MVMEKVSATGGTLNVDEFHIFPTYFYSRISHLQNGSTAYKDTKASRQRLYQDVKGWTKGVDIFQKRFLIFPINYDLHWTFVLAANPGDVLKVVPPASVPGGKKATEAAPVGTEVEAATIFNAISGQTDCDAGAVSSELSTATGKQSSAPHDADKEGADVTQTPSGTGKGMLKNDAVHVESAGGPQNQQLAEMDGESIENVSNTPTNKECNSATAAPAAAKNSNSSLAPCLIHFDSGRHFKLHRSAMIFKHIRKYLAAYYEALKAEDFPLCTITAKTLPGIAPPIPQQDNSKDCGVYTLEFIERVLANPPSVDANFIEQKGVVKGGPIGNNWFDQKSISKKRMDLTRLIRELEIREYLVADV